MSIGEWPRLVAQALHVGPGEDIQARIRPAPAEVIGWVPQRNLVMPSPGSKRGSMANWREWPNQPDSRLPDTLAQARRDSTRRRRASR